MISGDGSWSLVLYPNRAVVADLCLCFDDHPARTDSEVGWQSKRHLNQVGVRYWSHVLRRSVEVLVVGIKQVNHHGRGRLAWR